MKPENNESPVDNRRRRFEHFKNNWGNNLQQIDEEELSEDIIERGNRSPKSPIASRRNSTGSSCGSWSPPPHFYYSRMHLSSNQLIKHSFNNQTNYDDQSYCQCKKDVINTVNCDCGEIEDSHCEWVWHSNHKSTNVELENNDKDVLFNSDYSYGTSAATGSNGLSNNQFFWEIKMISPVYGTDMMVGIGTEHNDLKRNEKNFCSMLGEDIESWGLSYTGKFHYNGEFKFYSSKFGQGSIIGIHLDLWYGRLSFYKNRRLLGVACTGLRGKTLYPMVTSSAARSIMRLVRSRSFPSSLQFLVCQRLRQIIDPSSHVLDVLPIPCGLKNYLKNNLDWLLSQNETPSLINFSNEQKSETDSKLSSENSNLSSTSSNSPINNKFTNKLSNKSPLFKALNPSFNEIKFENLIKRKRDNSNEDSELKERNDDIKNNIIINVNNVDTKKENDLVNNTSKNDVNNNSDNNETNDNDNDIISNNNASKNNNNNNNNNNDNEINFHINKKFRNS